MTALRPLHPLSPREPNIATAAYPNKVESNFNGRFIMAENMQDDFTQETGSIASDLVSLDSDTSFGKMVIEQERAQRRLNDELRGNYKPFERRNRGLKQGLTMENLERKNAAEEARSGKAIKREFGGPRSVGSNRSEPPITAPAHWATRNHLSRHRLEMLYRKQPSTEDDTIPGEASDDDQTPRRTDRYGMADANVPFPSVEDSPLSRKSAQGTPPSSRRQNTALESIDDWDISDMNQASFIASTPYIPRNTKLDEIREREIESLREQAVATSQLEKIRESSPEEARKSQPTNTTIKKSPGREAASEGAQKENTSLRERTRRRTNSSFSRGKPQPVSGVGDQPPKSPIRTFKSAETVASVDYAVSAPVQSEFIRPGPKREDSHDLLRKLSRGLSSTPSPGRIADVRPRTAPAIQEDSAEKLAPAKAVTFAAKDSLSPEAEVQKESDPRNVMEKAEEQTPTEPEDDKAGESRATKPSTQAGDTESTAPPVQDAPKPAKPAIRVEDIESTPMPAQQAPKYAKTPKVTGGWIDTFIDTPAPAPTIPDPTPQTAIKPSSPLKRSSPSKKPVSKEEPTPPESSDHPPAKPPSPTKPSLPSSALSAILTSAKQKAKSLSKSKSNTESSQPSSSRPQDPFGDSTLESLESLISPSDSDSEREDRDHEKISTDDDTLQGLHIPPDTPKTESERQRRKEVLQLQNMNRKLRATRLSLRDARRGLGRVEHEVEHQVHPERLSQSEDGFEDGNGKGKGKRDGRVVYQKCRCEELGYRHGVQEGSIVRAFFRELWMGFKGLFWDKRMGRLTWLAVVLLGFLVWGVVELWLWYVFIPFPPPSIPHTICLSSRLFSDKYCHKFYASSMVGYGVDPDAPRMPFVTLTILSRPFLPLWNALKWIWMVPYNALFAQQETARSVVEEDADERLRRLAKAVLGELRPSREFAADEGWVGRMGDDEVI